MTDISQQLPWLQPSWSQLANYIKSERVPQALLITGNKGLGKQLLAKQFAQSLLCSTPQATGTYCEKCSSCTLFNAETHPDYRLIEPEEAGKVIGISIIRQLIEKLFLKPQFEKHRVVIINPADSLSNASANAFLKFLEEPTERTVLILVSEKPFKLPATIRSRCQKLNIPTPKETELATWCQQQDIIENKEVVLKLAQGAPLLAKQFSDSELLKLRKECFIDWLAYSRSEVDVVELAEQWCKSYKDKNELLLFWIISWVSDMVKLAHCEKATNLYNPDLFTDLKEILVKLDLRDLYKYYDFLLHSHHLLDTSLNKQLMIEEILIRWSILNGR